MNSLYIYKEYYANKTDYHFTKPINRTYKEVYKDDVYVDGRLTIKGGWFYVHIKDTEQQQKEEDYHSALTIHYASRWRLVCKIINNR